MALNKRGRGNSLNATSANFSARRPQSGGIPAWSLFTALKIAPGIQYMLEIGHDKGKCMRFLVLFRPLPNVGIQIFGMWGMYNLVKAYRSIKNPSPIAQSRLGSQQCSQLNCFTIHDTTLWANIFVCSHYKMWNRLRFFRFFAGLTNIPKTQKDANKQDFEIKLNLTCQFNHQNNRDLNQGIFHLWSKFGGPSLNRWWVIARTSSKWGKFWLWSYIWPWRSRSITPKNNRDLNQGLLHLWYWFGDP